MRKKFLKVIHFLIIKLWFLVGYVLYFVSMKQKTKSTYKIDGCVDLLLSAQGAWSVSCPDVMRGA